MSATGCLRARRCDRPRPRRHAWPSLILGALALFAAIAPAQPPADYYSLGDYDYFAPPAPASPDPGPSTAQPVTSDWPAAAKAPAVGAPGARFTATPQAGDQAWARAEGKALGSAQRGAAAAIPTRPGAAEQVPGYTASALPQSDYAEDPDTLVASGTTAASSSDSWHLVTNPARASIVLAPDALAGAKRIEREPESFLQGERLTADPGACRALPPGSAGQGFYEATCNEGVRVEHSTRSCRIPLIVETRSESRWSYTCETLFDRDRRNRDRLCTPFETHMETGSCREVDRVQVGRTCLQWGSLGCVEPGDPIDLLTLSCAGAVPGQAGVETRETIVTGERRDEQLCAAATAGASCTVASEICVDPGTGPRTVEGAEVSRPCWAWERTLDCGEHSSASDCGELDARPLCTFLREECLDDPLGGACKVRERVYRCPIPGGELAPARHYVCGGDVYCLNGECEPIEREASSEFKDALAGLHVLGQARSEFDETKLTLFGGTRESCHKPVFGLVNCCAGKSSGVLSAATGLAALAGGAGAIAALATPFLTTFLCSAGELSLDIKDRMGFCHKVGTWCSNSVLGICTSKRTAYCCFESKLSRILQEQGRPQLGLPWGAPKTEQCQGFSVDEFARLDLSRMDFAEVYAEFVDAARLPDELATAAAIKERIEAYYREKQGK